MRSGDILRDDPSARQQQNLAPIRFQNKEDMVEGAEERYVALIAGCVEFPFNNKKAKVVDKPDHESLMLYSPHVIPPPPFYKAHDTNDEQDDDDFINLISTGTASSFGFVGLKKTGFVYGFGRNEKGQLGAGDRVTRNCDFAARIPIFGLGEDHSGGQVTHIACGKQHTLFLNSEGEVYACGDNTWGQCGTGKASSDPILSPVKCVLPKGRKAVAVDCGIDFSLILDDGGILYSFGCPERGKLGNGTDGAYNAANARVFMKYEEFPTPTPIKFPSKGRQIVKFAAGSHHCVAVDNAGVVYVWGDGTHGRLGLGLKTENVHRPTAIDYGYWSRSPPNPKFVAAGTSCSIIVNEQGGVAWIWGKVSGNDKLKNAPQLLNDLNGWNPHCISCGVSSVGIGADNSTMEWGQASGELGFGVGKKSSANPHLNPLLEGFELKDIRMGAHHSIFLVKVPTGDPELVKKLEAFPVIPESQTAGVFLPKDELSDEEEQVPVTTKTKGAAKRKGSSGGTVPKAKKSKR
eukprot:TRINITY_DN47464_c0_g1_i2.p1 TRINITY_DN47464_c0_g1~~TRINITY_DN47464_c0_g1_i2.p1  ORF type:complete len:518 (+),score=138.60 TRINITY_DN47464_c0_g1_i2:54-1607(+)